MIHTRLRLLSFSWGLRGGIKPPSPQGCQEDRRSGYPLPRLNNFLHRLSFQCFKQNLSPPPSKQPSLLGEAEGVKGGAGEGKGFREERKPFHGERFASFSLSSGLKFPLNFYSNLVVRGLDPQNFSKKGLPLLWRRPGWSRVAGAGVTADNIRTKPNPQRVPNQG